MPEPKGGTLLDYLSKLDELVAKNHPQLAYEGDIPAYEDELDYVTISMKGVRIA